ncbi:MAG: GGDEF domain-containing protein [Betaproteobacteria bacterium]|nr:GGDEF domain-containing protein [Betaproteobacteria bacterium]
MSRPPTRSPLELAATPVAAIPVLLRELTAVAVVHFSSDGRILDANRGFLRLVQREGGAEALAPRLQDCLINPSLNEIRAMPALGSPPRVFSGIVTLGRGSELCTSLRAAVFEIGSADFLLIGEHDIADIERLGRTAMEVNDELARTQRELARRNRELHRAQGELAALARTDVLTGIGNRRELEERLPPEIERAERLGKPLALIMADLDWFKKVNDRYGHSVGDGALRVFAEVLRTDVRPYDLVARYGGEEFVVLLPETALAAAAEIAERMRLKLRVAAVPGLPERLSASFGVCERLARESGEHLLVRADAALYMAKHAGRDRVMAATD